MENQEAINTGSSYLWLIITGVLGLILAAGMLIYANKSSLKTFKKPRDGFLFVGLSGSGKTSLFTLLRTGNINSTYTSLKTNESWVRPLSEDNSTLIERYLRIIDIPGHEKLRNQEFNKRLPEARAIVFLVDSFAASKGASQLAELFYDVLSNTEVVSHSIPLLVVANKRDLATSITPEKLKPLLESELNNIRIARTSTNLEDLGDESALTKVSETEQFIGIEGKEFTFEDLTFDVAFLPLSLGPLPKPGASKHSANLKQLEEIVLWMDSISN